MFMMPYGYGTATVTEEQLRQKATFYRLHSEVQRRFLALSRYLWGQGVPLGVGTGWRIQPTDNRPGFASPGNSWHEGVPVESQLNALAIDTVPATSWDRMEPVLARFGFVSLRYLGEPWHIQPIEIPRSRNYATVLPQIDIWDLPNDPSNPQDEIMHGFVPISPSANPRIFDTRGPAGPNRDNYKLDANKSITVSVPNSSDKQFAVVNLASAESEANGWLIAWGSGAVPNSSKLNYQQGKPIANEVTVPIVNGKFTLRASSRTHVFVDLVGYYKEI